MMDNDWRIRRIRREAALAAAAFSETKTVDVDPDGGTWVVLRDMPLPAGYNRAVTDVLFQLPGSYPRTPPDWFFCDPGLRCRGRRPGHYFEVRSGRSAPTLRGWAACSLHLRSWRPSDDPLRGNSLLSLCSLAADAFARWRR
ncbi:MAG TPA: E2/UBC family protein [Armatimonadota bacterium]|jgi:hypothetical protein